MKTTIHASLKKIISVIVLTILLTLPVSAVAYQENYSFEIISLNELNSYAFSKSQNSKYPSWIEMNKYGLTADSVAQAYQIYYTALSNLVCKFDFDINDEVWEEFSDKFVNWFPYTLSGTFMYDQSENVFSSNLEYSLMQEMDALCFNRDGVYSKVSDEAKKYDLMINQILDEIITENMTEYEMAKAIHDYMVTNYEYDRMGIYGEQSHQFYGLLDNGKGVCQAYMELFYYLASYCGIECYTVSGTTNGDDSILHGWNVVLIGGNYYHVDVTFDDTSSDTISYDYFMVSDEEMAKDHTWDNYLADQWHWMGHAEYAKIY